MKKCFIITPIGNDDDPIRRHIDGIIDASIVPALCGEFEVIVAHRMSKSGSITKQVIEEINKADLVIANITDRNPNVMYELAIRHCLGTPTIMIAENKTQLPSDIISERTIFYRNDAKGVLELKDKLQDNVEKIDYQNRNSIVYDIIGEIINFDQIMERIKKENPQDENILQLILKRLDNIETSIKENEYQNNEFIGSIKVHELAKELNMNSKELLERINAMGIEAKSHMSGLSDIDAISIRNKINKERIYPKPKKPNIINVNDYL